MLLKIDGGPLQTSCEASHFWIWELQRYLTMVIQLLQCFESSGQSLKLPWCISCICFSFKIHQTSTSEGVLQQHLTMILWMSGIGSKNHPGKPGKLMQADASLHPQLQALQPGRTCSCSSPWSPKMASEKAGLSTLGICYGRGCFHPLVSSAPWLENPRSQVVEVSHSVSHWKSLIFMVHFPLPAMFDYRRVS